MEMHQIRYFLAVSELLNFTRAAERCNVSQPALTRGIKILEDELGGPLFNRERNQTNLTELGRLMLPFLQEVWQQQEAAHLRAKGFLQLTETQLRLGVLGTLGPTKLVPLVQGFRARNPGVELIMVDDRGKQLQEKVIQGELDIAILALPDGFDERLHVRPLFSERFMVITAPGHEFEARNAISAEDLHGRPCLSRAGCEYAPHIHALLHRRGVELKVVYRSEREDWVQALIMAGLGFGVFPESSIATPGIVTRPLVDPPIERTISVITVRGRPHTPALAALLKEIASHRFGTAPKPVPDSFTAAG